MQINAAESHTKSADVVELSAALHGSGSNSAATILPISTASTLLYAEPPVLLFVCSATAIEFYVAAKSKIETVAGLSTILLASASTTKSANDVQSI